jgi:ABC-type nitrate/sulfonate/bicarbonate transport system substrate-binding protein
VYNAGPSAMEAIFAESIDLTYVGPNPAINAYARSAGTEIRIVAGAINGGSALVAQAGEIGRTEIGQGEVGAEKVGAFKVCFAEHNAGLLAVASV